MALAFENFVITRRDLGGIVSAGGSEGTSMASQGMRALPIGCPKMMVSTMASGDTRPYVGPSDICMMYSVTDVQGINRISEKVLANAAHALAGMIAHPAHESATTKAAIGLTMFGVTTACVQAVTQRLGDDYDCLVFHATGVGGRAMEELVSSDFLGAVFDITTTEVADEVVGGVFPAGPDRFDVILEKRLPYIMSLGALDMVNFGPVDTVPAVFKDRKFHIHNSSVTLMRTTVEENLAFSAWIARKLNAHPESGFALLIPEGGVSELDKPGHPFFDPEADQALFNELERLVQTGTGRRIVRHPFHINDAAFAAALQREIAQLQIH